VFIVWLVTLLEIVFLSVVYFHTWIMTAAFSLVFIIFFAVAYKQLEKSYQWFESQLVRNIAKKPGKQSKYKELAPWDMHFVEIEVGNRSPLTNKSLGESKIRERFGVNVVAIYRGHNTILAPRGDVRMYDNDKLIVLGNDEQIDRFRRKATMISQDTEQISLLDSFIFKPIVIENNHPFVGKSIRESQIREQLQGLVMGIERGNTRILNPLPETVLEADDLLLVVGKDETIKDIG
jgi:CPA2 family monovalent cation:H+ antiporter-2